MSTIIITEDQTNQVIADGVLGKEVLNIEGNYYFNKENVKLEELAIEPKAYTCPIKKGTCDYYFLKNEKGDKTGSEIAWIYDAVENNLFKQLEGKVGFYGRSGRGLTLTVME